MTNLTVGWSDLIGNKLIQHPDLQKSLSGKNVLEIAPGTGASLAALALLGVKEYNAICFFPEYAKVLAARIPPLEEKFIYEIGPESINHIFQEEIESLFETPEPLSELPNQISGRIGEMNVTATYLFEDRYEQIIPTLQHISDNYGLVMTAGIIEQKQSLFGSEENKITNNFVRDLFNEFARITPSGGISIHTGLSPYLGTSHGNFSILNQTPFRNDRRYVISDHIHTNNRTIDEEICLYILQKSKGSRFSR